MGHTVAKRTPCGVPSHTPRPTQVLRALLVGCLAAGALGQRLGRADALCMVTGAWEAPKEHFGSPGCLPGGGLSAQGETPDPDAQGLQPWSFFDGSGFGQWWPQQVMEGWGGSSVAPHDRSSRTSPHWPGTILFHPLDCQSSLELATCCSQSQVTGLPDTTGMPGEMCISDQ